MISFSSVQYSPAQNPIASVTSTATQNFLIPYHCHTDKLSFTSPPFFHPADLPCHLNCLGVQAIDATQPYDYEAQLVNRFTQSTKLRIAIIGFGNFGQFLAKALIRQGHTIFAHSRSDYSSVAQSLGAAFFFDTHDHCKQHPDVILLCMSIISTESVLKSLPIQHLRRNTLFVDVLSVKEFPKNIFLQYLPSHFDVLCSHPIFGLESGKNGWQNLIFVFDEVRIGNEESRLRRAETFLDIFKNEGCGMLEMTCAEHDKYAAGSQFIMHTMGRILKKL